MKATKKFNFPQPGKKKLKRKQHNFRKNLEMSVVRDMWQIYIPLPKMMSIHNAKQIFLKLRLKIIFSVCVNSVFYHTGMFTQHYL